MSCAKVLIILCVCSAVIVGGEPDGGNTRTSDKDPDPADGSDKDPDPADGSDKDPDPADGSDKDPDPADGDPAGRKYQVKDLTEEELEAFKNEFKGSETQHARKYVHYPIRKGTVRFQVRAARQGRIILAEKAYPEESDHVLEVLIGGWSNQKSAIHHRQAKKGKVAVTPEILSKDEFRGFWINIKDGVIKMGKTDADTPFLIYSEPDHLPKVRFCAVSFSAGDEEIWIFGEESSDGSKLAWVQEHGGSVPDNSVLGGYERKELYVCRAELQGAVTPGKIVPSDGYCYVSWGGFEHHMTEYEVLTGSNFEWEKATKDKIPDNAVPGGKSEGGEVLYIGRVEYEGNTIIGKVQRSHGVCYIPYYNEEKKYETYEILVQKNA